MSAKLSAILLKRARRLSSRRTSLLAVAERRGWAGDSIYWSEQRRRWVGVISRGYGPDGMRRRRQVSGRTKRKVQDKLKALHEELDAGVADVYAALEGGAKTRSTRTVVLMHNALERAIPTPRRTISVAAT